MESANLRNLDQIQEQEGRGRPMQLLTVGLGVLVLGLLTVVGITVVDRRGQSLKPSADPLEELVKQARRKNVSPESELKARDLTFPKVLSDHGQPTTALAAVKDERGRVLPADAAPAGSADAEWARKVGDNIPTRLQATGDLLNASSVTREPKDSLVALAVRASGAPGDAVAADPGNDGGVQLQVASFQSNDEADALVGALRQRGHQAFRIAAVIPGRGTWHRVRLGPFKTRFEAERYKRSFEKKERLSPYVVDPEQVKRAEEIRDAKHKARLAKQKAQ